MNLFILIFQNQQLPQLLLQIIFVGSLDTMEQKDNNIIEFPNKPVEENTSAEEVKEVNPIIDAFNAISGIMNNSETDEDMTKILGAMLALPENDFNQIAPVILDEVNKSLNNVNNRIALVSIMIEQGYKGDDLTNIFIKTCEEIDAQLTDISQIKKDWLKQLMGIVANAVNETEGISKRYITIPYEICHEKAKEPAYAHVTDSGMDVFALEDIILAPGEQKIIPIGIKVAIPAGYELQVRPKSGISAKTKLRIANAPGTIDAGYRDEIGIIVENVEPPIKDIQYDFNDDGSVNINSMSIIHGSSYTIGEGQKIAQLVLAEVPKVTLLKVEKVSDIGEDRGGGFGSTGLK
jgi:dUTP pyrophosphatase